MPRTVVRLVEDAKVWAGGAKDDVDAGPAFARLAERFAAVDPRGTGMATLLSFSRTVNGAGP